MTFFHSAIEFQFTPYENLPQPEPRTPEDVIRLLTLETPEGEHSVDVF